MRVDYDAVRQSRALSNDGRSRSRLGASARYVMYFERRKKRMVTPPSKLVLNLLRMCSSTTVYHAGELYVCYYNVDLFSMPRHIHAPFRALLVGLFLISSECWCSAFVLLSCTELTTLFGVLKKS